ncbi:cation diffusion facilitator family transporter [Paenibacillus bovis]|uniref:Zinc transporter ZitB n=1 Tax=Paenibacillus bovis TaxID=1616788 RepID=A0A172ZIN5_9BACL|nr:cation diffusion facilitator family transporter [Paenibacillus bovis]ANF97147.1 zinc transporter ZitB [Paenibacillus bovis]
MTSTNPISDSEKTLHTNHSTTHDHAEHAHHGHSHHGHSHHHGHGHNHSHAHNANKKALGLAFFLIAAFMIVEVIGGIVTNSLALLSDAGHMFSDAAALGLSFVAMVWGQRQASGTKTYGYKRFEVLAAFLNGIALVVISLYIFWEAFQRFSEPQNIMSSGMLTIAIIGLIVNILAAYILMKGDTSENLNIRSAFLHVIGDLLGSVGAIVAALLIMFFGWTLADPIASIIVAVLVLISAYRVTRDSVHILMEGTPVHIHTEEITRELAGIPHVQGVHDLHVWSLSSDLPLLSCHLIIDDTANGSQIMKSARELIQQHYGIGHITIQLDTPDMKCEGNKH